MDDGDGDGYGDGNNDDSGGEDYLLMLIFVTNQLTTNLQGGRIRREGGQPRSGTR